jgi:sigma-B regulation protein RsbQ
MSNKAHFPPCNNVQIIGDGRETIVFAHGVGTDQHAWRHQVEHFFNDYRLVLFDHAGATPGNASCYSAIRYRTLQSYANDLLEICHAMQLRNAILMTHSVGGIIGLLAAINEPSFFRKIILMNASPRYLNDGAYRGGFEQSDLNLMYESMSSNFHSWCVGFAPLITGDTTRPDVAREFASTLGSLRPDIALSVLRTIFESDYRHILPKVSRPVVILQSTNDIAAPLEVGQYMQKQIPGSVFESMDIPGHLPHLTRPEEVIRLMEKHLGR